jgi:hypothetical protein
MKAAMFIAFPLLFACGAGSAESRSSVTPANESGAAPDATASETAPAGSALSDGKAVAFRADFSNIERGHTWNLFGGQNQNRGVKGDASGLLVRIVDGERPWDAVGLRTAKVAVEGDFDLRARFTDFSVGGNGSAKLIVVDAAAPRGEAAYVERIQIDGKNLFKFGGEIDGELENWGYVPTEATSGDLRLARRGNQLHGYARSDESAPWSEIGKPQPVPASLPARLKVGVKVSADLHKSASVLFVDLTLDGKLLRD